jgi:hypothetical protein
MRAYISEETENKKITNEIIFSLEMAQKKA